MAKPEFVLRSLGCWRVGVRCVGVCAYSKFNKLKRCVMSKINRFEDLRCWQASRKLNKFSVPTSIILYLQLQMQRGTELHEAQRA